MHDDASTASQLRAFVLLATLRTANDLRHAFAERRAGRDPSAQEPEPEAYAWILGVLPEMQRLVTRLRVSLVVEREEHAALVHAFEDRLVLGQLARTMHVVHQRLLSLYPEVPEVLIEQARLRQQEAERLASASGAHFERLLTAWLDRMADLFEGLAKALPAAN